jgi:hypothetical protein
MALTLTAAISAARDDVALAGLNAEWQRIGDAIVTSAAATAEADDDEAGITVADLATWATSLVVYAAQKGASEQERITVFERNLVLLHGQVTDKARSKYGAEPPVEWAILGDKWSGDVAHTFGDMLNDATDKAGGIITKAATGYGMFVGLGVLLLGLFTLGRK